MKIKNLKKSLAVLIALALLAASIPMSAFNVFAASSTYDIAYENGVATVNGVNSTVADAFKVSYIKDTTTEYSKEAAVAADGKLSITNSPRNSSKKSINSGNYMFTVQKAPERDLLSYELTIPTIPTDFIGAPHGLLIPLYYDAATNRYVSVCSSLGYASGSPARYRIGRAFITAKYFGYYKDYDKQVNVAFKSVSSVNVKVSYTYDGDTISSVDLVFKLYDSSNALLATLSQTYTADDILTIVNVNSSTYTDFGYKPSSWEGDEGPALTSLAKSGALAGFISGDSPARSTISFFKATYDKSADVAAEFVNQYQEIIKMEASAITTLETANDVIAAYSAYTALDDAVKTVLASYVIDGVTYNVGERLSALNDAAVMLLPTAAQTDFKNYYNANIAALAEAEGKLDEINTALGLYNAVEDSHKGNVSTQYAHICDLLDGYFITNNDETLTKDLTYDASSLTEYGYVNSYFKNSVFVETANSRNNKVTDPAKFDSTKARSVKVAFKYGETNTAVTAYKYNVGFSFFPVLDSINGLSNTENKIFYSLYRERKTLYINGESQGNKKIYLYYLPFGTLGDIAKISTNTSNQFFRSSEFGSFEMLASSFGSPTVNTKYNNNVFPGIYQLPATRIVFDFDYTVTTTVDAQKYKLLTITFSNITVWAESDGNNTYNADSEDILLTKQPYGLLAYRYTEETAPMPFFSTDDASLDSMLYFNSSVDYTFEQKYADVLDNPSPNANKTLEMYAEYQADTSAVEAGTPEKIEKAVTKAGLRPTAGGATLSVKADTHIGFYVDKPVATGVTSTVGALVSAYNYMVDNHISVLTKGMGDEGVLEATPQSNQYCSANQLMLKVKNLYGAANNWGRWIVVRYYATYTVGGKDVVIYSTTPEDDINDNNNPASATGVSHDGVAIRSINYLIKCIANEMATKVDTKGDIVGAVYKDIDNADKTTYTEKTLSQAVADNGGKTIFSTALDTMYFLMSYKDAII